MSGVPPEKESPKSPFPTTSWTIVHQMGNGEVALRIVAWEEFCQSYWRPIHGWLKARGVESAIAEDLVQDFFLKFHGKPVAIQSLDPAKGRLRSYLFTALRHHLADHHRSRNAARRGAGAAHVALDDNDARAFADSPAAADQDAFDREWALAVMSRAIRLIREEYLARGSGQVFEALFNLLDPQPPEIREAARNSLGFTENRFNAAFMRFRDRLAIALRQEVSGTLATTDDAAINDELRHLIRLFVRAGGVGALDTSDRNP